MAPFGSHVAPSVYRRNIFQDHNVFGNRKLRPTEFCLLGLYCKIIIIITNYNDNLGLPCADRIRSYKSTRALTTAVNEDLFKNILKCNNSDVLWNLVYENCQYMYCKITENNVARMTRHHTIIKNLWRRKWATKGIFWNVEVRVKGATARSTLINPYFVCNMAAESLGDL